MAAAVVLASLVPTNTSAASVRVAGPLVAELAPRARPKPPEVRVALADTPRPRVRDNRLPRARWEQRRDGPLWTRVTLSALEAHGQPLLTMVPEDIDAWCPAYPDQTPQARAAFWAALVSTLARYESTWNPRAVGGGGLWHGLMQILPTTAELRGCRVTSGAGLLHGPSNLSCAVRIMSITVPRDGAIAIKGTRRWQGVAADWGPIRTDWMRRDMQRYTRSRTYCRPLASVQPRPRPESVD